MGNDLTHEVVGEGTEVDDTTRVTADLSTFKKEVRRNANNRVRRMLDIRLKSSREEGGVS